MHVTSVSISRYNAFMSSRLRGASWCTAAFVWTQRILYLVPKLLHLALKLCCIWLGGPGGGLILPSCLFVWQDRFNIHSLPALQRASASQTPDIRIAMKVGTSPVGPLWVFEGLHQWAFQEDVIPEASSCIHFASTSNNAGICEWDAPVCCLLSCLMETGIALPCVIVAAMVGGILFLLTIVAAGAIIRLIFSL